jgi:hypothetical protein
MRKSDFLTNLRPASRVESLNRGGVVHLRKLVEEGKGVEFGKPVIEGIAAVFQRMVVVSLGDEIFGTQPYNPPAQDMSSPPPLVWRFGVPPEVLLRPIPTIQDNETRQVMPIDPRIQGPQMGLVGFDFNHPEFANWYNTVGRTRATYVYFALNQAAQLGAGVYHSQDSTPCEHPFLAANLMLDGEASHFVFEMPRVGNGRAFSGDEARDRYESLALVQNFQQLIN